MGTMNRIILTAVLIFSVSASVSSQDIFDKVKDKIKEKTKDGVNKVADKYYYWAKVNVSVSWIENGEKKYENRIYYSEIVKTSYDRYMEENFIKYFNKGVIEPQQAAGYELNYYDSDVYLFPKDYSYGSMEEAEQDMNHKLDNDKTWERPIYSFKWEPDKTPSGETTTQPKKIFN